MAWHFHSKKELAKLLGVTRDFFHYEIKHLIKADFLSELKQIGCRNPDIFLDDNNLIRLADPRNHNSFIDTEVNIFDYIS